MKVKRVKQAKRLVSLYQHNFGLRQPFQVLVDGTFAQAALKAKIQLKEQLPKYLSGSVQLLNTKCVLLETQLIGAPLYGAQLVLKRLETRHCNHSIGKTVSTCECILRLIGEDNKNNYLVATQDEGLRTKLRQIPGVPILLITHNAIALEKPSRATRQAADKLASQKLEGSVVEQKALAELDKLNRSPEPPKKKKRRRTPAGPNPLSCKKKKKAKEERQQTEERTSRKRKRRRRHHEPTAETAAV